ncbi:MAG: hypothetical protein AAGI37_15460 [Planctomycetota bacterium]
MAKKTIQGLGGSVTNPTGWNFKVSGFSFTYTVLTEETTGFEDGGFETHEPVAVRWEGSMTGTLEYDDANAAPIPASMADGSGMALGDLDSAKGSSTFQAIDGCTLAGTVVVTNMPITRNTKGRGEVTLNVLGTGALTEAWDEAA